MPTAGTNPPKREVRHLVMGPVNARVLRDRVVADQALEFDAGHIRLGNQVLTLVNHEVEADDWTNVTRGSTPLSRGLFDPPHW